MSYKRYHIPWVMRWQGDGGEGVGGGGGAWGLHFKNNPKKFGSGMILDNTSGKKFSSQETAE